MSEKKPFTLGLIVGHRDIFPEHVADEGGKTVIGVLNEQGFKITTLFSEESGWRKVQNREDSKKYAELFRRKKDEINGILVTLPDFGDERSLAEALRLSDLDVPVLLHAFPDEIGKMVRENRRDAFCGKISASNALHQYGIPFTNTRLHTEAPDSEAFKADLRRFKGVCRVVNGLRRARIGTIGVRPGPFTTMRYSEKILENQGISVEKIGMLEMLERAKSLDAKSPSVKQRLTQMNGYFSSKEVSRESIEKTAKLLVAASEWARENELDAVAVQCWPTIEKFYGIAPCAAMSMMSEELRPSACETDVMGSLSMYALQLASGKPAALVDINNNYRDDPDKFVAFHCSNFPKSFFKDGKCGIGYHEMQEVDGACVGRIASLPATFLRISSDEERGKIRAYIAEGQFTDDELETFGGYGVAKIDELQSLMDFIIAEGFEHHVAVAHDRVANVLEEAMGKYLGWEVYRHSPPRKGNQEEKQGVIGCRK